MPSRTSHEISAVSGCSRFLRRPPRIASSPPRHERGRRAINTKAGTIKVETVADGLVHPLGTRLPPRRPDAGDGASGTAPPRVEDGDDLDATLRRARSLCHGAGGIARCGASTLTSSRTVSSISPISEPGEGGARPRWRAGNSAESGLDDVDHHLPPEPKVQRRQPFRLASRLRPRRQAVRHPRRALHLRARPGPHQSTSARSCASIPTARCRRTIPSSGRRMSSPEIWSYGHRNPQGAAINPEDRQAVGERIRPDGRRRAQHPESWRKLRLAGGELGIAL